MKKFLNLLTSLALVTSTVTGLSLAAPAYAQNAPAGKKLLCFNTTGIGTTQWKLFEYKTDTEYHPVTGKKVSYVNPVGQALGPCSASSSGKDYLVYSGFRQPVRPRLKLISSLRGSVTELTDFCTAKVGKIISVSSLGGRFTTTEPCEGTS